MKSYKELASTNKYDAELNKIYSGFPKEYNDGFSNPWDIHLENLKKDKLMNLAIEYKCLKELSIKYPGDITIVRAMILIKNLFYENKELIENYPHCFPFRESSYKETIFNAEEVKEYFFYKEAFGPYKKGCDNFANPNVYESTSFEVGKYRKGAWERTGIKSATHIGCYFDSSYLGSNFVKNTFIEKVYERNCSSHRRQHIFKFIIKPLKFQIKLTNVEGAKSKDDFYKLGLMKKERNS